MFDLSGRLAELPYRFGAKHKLVKERHSTTVVCPRKLDLSGRLAELPYRFGPKHTLVKERHSTAVVWPRKLEWPPAAGLVCTLRDALERSCIVYEDDIPQPYSGVILLRVNGRSVVLDYSDYHERISAGALKESSLYIKLQYRAGGYSDDRIVPGGYSANSIDFYRYYMPFRRRGKSQDQYRREVRIDVSEGVQDKGGRDPKVRSSYLFCRT
jgi:hypothetical protein